MKFGKALKESKNLLGVTHIKKSIFYGNFNENNRER